MEGGSRGRRARGVCGALLLELVGARGAAPAALLPRESRSPDASARAWVQRGSSARTRGTGAGAGRGGEAAVDAKCTAAAVDAKCT